MSLCSSCGKIKLMEGGVDCPANQEAIQVYKCLVKCKDGQVRGKNNRCAKPKSELIPKKSKYPKEYTEAEFKSWIKKHDYKSELIEDKPKKKSPKKKAEPKKKRECKDDETRTEHGQCRKVCVPPKTERSKKTGKCIKPCPPDTERTERGQCKKIKKEKQYLTEEEDEEDDEDVVIDFIEIDDEDDEDDQLEREEQNWYRL